MAIVVSTPTCFFMARPVNSAWCYDDLTDPSKQTRFPDAWWIYLAAGSDVIQHILDFNHLDLKRAGWERHNKPRFYPIKQFERCLKTGLSLVAQLSFPD